MQFPFGYIIGAGLGIVCTLVAVFIVRWIQKKQQLTSSKKNIENVKCAKRVFLLNLQATKLL